MIWPTPSRAVDTSSSWHFYDNDGDYKGLFSWVPRRLRVGPWSPLVPLFLVAWWTAMAAFVQRLHPLPLALPRPYSTWWWIDAALSLNCLATLAVTLHRWSIAPLLTTHTMWTWHLLTLRSLLVTAASPLVGSPVGMTLGAVAEALRFPVAAGTTVTFVLWNFALFPLVVMMMPKERKDGFVSFNFSFPMVQIHMVNLPAAFLSIACGGPEGGARLFRPTDLWASSAVCALYAALYLFLLDRVGVHFYPMFSPRSHLCIVAYFGLLACYCGAYIGWNALIDAQVCADLR